MRRARMRALALLMAVLVAVALGGCVTTGPSASELKARWDAANVFPQGYRQDLLAFLRTYLNDPSHVRSASVSQPQLKYIGPGDRYVACVRYNARNSDGKYRRIKRRCGDLRGRQARSLPRHAKGRARALQGGCVRAVPGTGTADPIAHKSTTAAGLGSPAVKSASKRLVSSDVSGHLTLRFSADVFPRFSTSSN